MDDPTFVPLALRGARAAETPGQPAYTTLIYRLSAAMSPEWAKIFEEVYRQQGHSWLHGAMALRDDLIELLVPDTCAANPAGVQEITAHLAEALDEANRQYRSIHRELAEARVRERERKRAVVATLQAILDEQFRA